MTFGEKLRTLRKQTGLSQEKLAEKLSVSRQAVTKWETESGIPDIENLMAISALFGVSVDELLSNERKNAPDYLFESATEYDIGEPKRYDMKLGGAKQLILSGYPSLCEQSIDLTLTISPCGSSCGSPRLTHFLPHIILMKNKRKSPKIE